MKGPIECTKLLMRNEVTDINILFLFF